MKLAGIIGAALIMVVGGAWGGVKTTPRLEEALRTTAARDPVMLWVFFSDKGRHALSRSTIPGELVTQQSLDRRAKVRVPGNLVDETDLPLEPSYVAAVAPLVLTIRHSSKWFNGVSVMAMPEQIPSLEALPFVRGIDLVYRQGRPGDRERIEQPAAVPPAVPARVAATNSLDYGPSFTQVSLENIPAVHDSGNSAQGIVIGVFDNGFRMLAHQAFDLLRSRIIGTYDFVDHKVSVAPLNPTHGYHGVNTLSTLAGYFPGKLIGPAYGASFILARTENDSSETPVEEDNWVRAIEWADSLGVQVTSTSLGYYTYDAPFTSWTWQNMDGKTTLITRAADMAVGKGIIVVNSVGNERVNRGNLPNTLNAPADGDSVLAVGAVTINLNGTVVYSYFSSYGPTFDNRIKPEVMAQGTSIYAADGGSPTGYTWTQGTSFSCPLTAGVAALVLKSHPLATPMQIVNALKKSASRATAPDNDYGWGVVNAARAIAYLNGDTLQPQVLPQTYALGQNYPNPFNPGTKIEFLLPEAASITLKVYDILGREVRVLLEGAYAPSSTVPYRATWDGTDDAGRRLSSGVYFYRLEAKGASGTSFTKVRKMMLLR